MFTGAVHKKDECEANLAQLVKAEVQKLWDRTVVYYDQAMEARRHGPLDPGPQHEPDFGERLRKVEGRLGQDYPEVRIHHTEGGGKNSWKDWILIILGALIVAWLGRLDSKMDDIADLKADQRVMKEHQLETDKHLESTDGRVDRVETRVYRGSP